MSACACRPQRPNHLHIPPHHTARAPHPTPPLPRSRSLRSSHSVRSSRSGSRDGTHKLQSMMSIKRGAIRRRDSKISTGPVDNALEDLPECVRARTCFCVCVCVCVYACVCVHVCVLMLGLEMGMLAPLACPNSSVWGMSMSCAVVVQGSCCSTYARAACMEAAISSRTAGGGASPPSVQCVRPTACPTPRAQPMLWGVA